ncbi:hypothetical protein [Spirulina sp. 06S082]|uniref:hypothetical protein n=1 Tax=Spirulina sp. 06S082 TaxID=3110248 RepID=UPI002B213ABF|nr:hypothetical protein [Spirulina sp. 06S082]MEA5471261.1 hypothetical protein [Spirulina sp. 06S082]
MNVKLLDSLIQIIQSLSDQERILLEERLFFDPSYPSSRELSHLAQSGGAFDFLYEEPDLYTLEDGEEIQWQ